MSHEDDQLRYDVLRWPKWPVRESPWRYALRNAVCEVLDEAGDKSLTLAKRRALIRHTADMERFWLMILEDARARFDTGRTSGMNRLLTSYPTEESWDR